jgi:hypothetical protein
VAVRDSKNPNDAMLIFTAPSYAHGCTAYGPASSTT